MAEVTREHTVCVLSMGVGKGMLWCLLEQKLSLWTISCMNCKEPGAHKVQSSSRRKLGMACVCVCVCVCVRVHVCVYMCVCVMVIRATTLFNSRTPFAMCSMDFQKAPFISKEVQMMPP